MVPQSTVAASEAKAAKASNESRGGSWGGAGRGAGRRMGPHFALGSEWPRSAPPCLHLQLSATRPARPARPPEMTTPGDAAPRRRSLSFPTYF